MQGNRLHNAKGILSILEPGGGLGPNKVYKLVGGIDDAYLPEEAIRPVKTTSQSAITITPAMLDQLAAHDEIADVLSRFVSYIVVIPNASHTFATPTIKVDKSVQALDNAKLQELLDSSWEDLQKHMFSGVADLLIGIHQFVHDWLTYGKLWACLIREVDKKDPNKFGNIIEIVCQTDVPQTQHDNRTNTKVLSTTDGKRIASKDDIIQLDYAQIDPSSLSYVASLLRSFNLFRTVERTRIANAVMSATFRKIYTVPTSGLTKTKAMQRLSKIMSLYKRTVTFDDSLGEFKINGENNYPVNTEIWLSETAAGKLAIDGGGGDGEVSLDNLELVEYFARKFYKRSKLPMSKFEAVDAGYLSGIGELDEDERQFELLIAKHRAVLGQFYTRIMLKYLEQDSQVAGSTAIIEHIQNNVHLDFFDELRAETPLEQLEQMDDALTKIENVLDTYLDTLTKSGCPENIATGLINALRKRLVRKYCPSLVGNNEVDMALVERDTTKTEDDEDTADDNSDDEDPTDDAGADDDFSDWDW